MKKYRVKPGTRVKLDDYPADDKSEFDGSKKDADGVVQALMQQVDGLQEKLYAGGTRAVLFVLQALDTGGKDGTIRRVFSPLNPAGVHVATFKQPTSRELAHDYLWRAHKAMPERGHIGIFNRSHYEDVLVVRVHHLAPKEEWQKRYEQINAFESMLTQEGTTIVKFFLHISKEEQKQRLLARLQDPTKHWKFNPADLAERKLWDEYQKAYEDALSETSTDAAPWYIVPADRKWYRNIVIATVARDTLQALNPQYPQPQVDMENLVIE